MAEKVYGEGSLGTDFSQDEAHGFDLRDVKGGVETNKSRVDDGTAIMTENEFFFVEGVKDLFSRKKNGAYW